MPNFVQMQKIIDIIGSRVAISPSKANLLYDYFVDVLKTKSVSVFSFAGIEDCSSAFCNASIGKLYMNYDRHLIDGLIHFSDYEKEEIWSEKIKRAMRLGIEKNLRDNNQMALENLLN